jgi:nucleotide-binding universal stress UspA family protein
MSSTAADARERVVVGYDASATSVAAVEWAAEQAKARGLPLEGRHVVEPLPAMGEGAELAAAAVDDELQDEADRGAKEGAEIAAKAVGAGGGPVVALGLVGHPVASLVDGSESAALLVVGAHGHGDLASRLVGSVAFAATVHSRCPVAVVRGAPPPRAGTGRPVMVGVDGSRSSLAALLEAAGIAERSGAELVVVCCWRATAPGRWGVSWSTASPEERAANEHRLAAEAVASDAAERVRHVRPGLATSTRVLEGAPARVLADISSAAGLLVLGSRGRGGFAGLLLGSVTRRLVHESACPVLVVRRVAERT